MILGVQHHSRRLVHARWKGLILHGIGWANRLFQPEAVLADGELVLKSGTRSSPTPQD